MVQSVSAEEEGQREVVKWKSMGEKGAISRMLSLLQLYPGGWDICILVVKDNYVPTIFFFLD